MRCIAAIAGAALSVPALAGSIVLGPAADYNVFVLGDHTAQYSDVEGRVAVGGNAAYNGYSIGLSIGNSGTNLVVGGGLTFTNGTVYGASTYGGSLTTDSTVNYTGGVSQGSPVSFAGAAAALQTLASSLGSIAPTGTAAKVHSSLNLTGLNAGLNVIQIDGSALLTVSEVNISAPAGSTVLVNVTGAAVTLPNFGYNFTGIDRSRVLYNFPNASTLTLGGSFNGSVLAPNAAVSTTWGQLNGQMMAGSLSGPLQFNHVPFNGQITLVPLPPAAWAGLLMLAGVGEVRALRRR